MEINYNGNAWIGLGGNEQNPSFIPRVFYYPGANIMIYYSSVTLFQNCVLRMMVMKVQ
jgi:hypothetical protein